MLHKVFGGSAWTQHPVFRAITMPISALHAQFKGADDPPLNPYQVKMMHALNERAIEDGNGRPDRAYIIRDGCVQRVEVQPPASIEVGPIPPEQR